MPPETLIHVFYVARGCCDTWPFVVCLSGMECAYRSCDWCGETYRLSENFHSTFFRSTLYLYSLESSWYNLLEEILAARVSEEEIWQLSTLPSINTQVGYELLSSQCVAEWKTTLSG